MLNKNVARIEARRQVGILAMGPGAADWHAWIGQAGFQVAGQEDAEVILWIDPETNDFSTIAADPRSIVVGDLNVQARCRHETIEYVKDVEDGEAVRKQLEEFAYKAREAKESTLPAKNRSTTVPPALSAKRVQTKQRITLQRVLTKTKSKPQEITDFPPEDTGEAEQSEDLLFEQRKEIIAAFPFMGDGGHRLKQYIQEKSEGGFRILEVAESYTSLMQAAEKGFFDILLVHRELPGLERNLVENLKYLRSKAPESRIILIERETDEYSDMYKNHLSLEAIEWQVIPKIPGRNLINILRGQEERPPEKRQESRPVFEWDDWEEGKTAPLTAPLPAVRSSSVLSPVLIAYHSAGGGVGKSTGSTQMGFVFAQMGYKTLIVELDTEKPSLLRTVGAGEDCPGLSAWNHADFTNERTAIEALHRTSRQVHGLYVLPVGPVSPKKSVLPFHLEGGEDGTDPCQQAETFYNAALKEFQIVIVDTNTSSIDPPVFMALKMAKRIFYVMEATKVFLDSAEAHLQQAYELGIELSNYRIILNKCTPHELVSLRTITQTLDIPVSLQVPLDVEGYRLAAHQGKPYQPKKGESPWSNFSQAVLQDLQVPVTTTQVRKSSLKNWLLGWRKNNTRRKNA